MSNEKRDTWVTIKTESGEVRVHAGSLIALASDWIQQDEIKQLEQGRMAWSLGEFPDLLWMIVPEARSLIVELACEKLRDAHRQDRLLGPISDYALANDLYREILVPALTDLPTQRHLVARCLTVIRHLIMMRDENHYWDLFNIEVLYPLMSAGWTDALSSIDKELLDMARERQARH